MGVEFLINWWSETPKGSVCIGSLEGWVPGAEIRVQEERASVVCPTAEAQGLVSEALGQMATGHS